LANLIFAEPEVSVCISLRRIGEEVGYPSAALPCLESLEDLQAKVGVHGWSVEINPGAEDD
jgi:hypothetical protein